MKIISISDDSNSVTTDDGVVHRAAVVNEGRDGCEGCDFLFCNTKFCLPIPCESKKRSDGLSVIFVTLVG